MHGAYFGPRNGRSFQRVADRLVPCAMVAAQMVAHVRNDIRIDGVRQPGLRWNPATLEAKPIFS